MNGELLRLIDALHREKDIEKEILFEAIESAITSAVKKRHNPTGDIITQIDRESGAIAIFEEGERVEYTDMGRIQAQTAKQVIIQKIREAERDVIFAEYEDRVGTIVNGNVQRIEGGNVIVNLGRAEGVLTKPEKIRGENYQPGDRIKALIQEVRKLGQKVKIMLTRASPDLVVRLFELEVPEISEKIIEIKRIAREPGYRTKIAVSSYDSRVDCIGACVGIRGSRIKSITDELNDEKIDIIRWNESAEVLIINSLKPAQISSMILDEENKIARVLVPDDMLSLAIGRKGQNVRLAAKLTGWEIKIESSTSSLDGGKDKEEDPEVAGVREALFQGTSFETQKKVEAPPPEPASEEPPAAGTDEPGDTGEPEEVLAEAPAAGAEESGDAGEPEEVLAEAPATETEESGDAGEPEEVLAEAPATETEESGDAGEPEEVLAEAPATETEESGDAGEPEEVLAEAPAAETEESGDAGEPEEVLAEAPAAETEESDVAEASVSEEDVDEKKRISDAKVKDGS